jgi:hypothetical protein
VNCKGETYEERDVHPVLPLNTAQMIIVPGLLEYENDVNIDLRNYHYMKLLFDISGNIEIDSINWSQQAPEPQVLEGSAFQHTITLSHNFFSANARHYLDQQIRQLRQHRRRLNYTFQRPKVKFRIDDFTEVEQVILENFVELSEEDPIVEFLVDNSQNRLSFLEKLIPNGDPEERNRGEMHTVMIHEDDINFALCLFAMSQDGGITLG